MAWSKDSVVKSVIVEFLDSFEGVVQSNSRVGYLTIYLAEWNELILVTGGIFIIRRLFPHKWMAWLLTCINRCENHLRLRKRMWKHVPPLKSINIGDLVGLFFFKRNLFRVYIRIYTHVIYLVIFLLSLLFKTIIVTFHDL